MDSHKLNMYAGSIIGALLFFLLLGFFSDLIFVGRGHHDDPLAFAVEVEGGESSGGEAVAVDWSALVAAADAGAGEKIFKKCASCHKLEDGANGVGPHLFGVVGRDIASVSGYSYSDALTALDGDWGLEALAGFLASPKTYASGTKMSFAGIKSAEDQVNLIVYLNEADGTPIELATAPAAGEATTEVAAATGDGHSTEPAAAAEATTETATETATEAATETATETAAETAAASTEAAAEATEATTETATEPAATTETASATTEAPAAADGGGIASLLASADSGEGKKVFRKCRACHSPDEGKNGVGPSLWGVIGRDIASVDGYKYSDAMSEAEGNWTGSRLFEYLADPAGSMPGNKMKFAGVKDEMDRVNVITYLNENDGTPDALE